MNLAKTKKQYETLRKKYSLPNFQQLNEEFDIEKVAEKETDLLLREIRRCISDKIAAYLRFFELFLNPMNAPFFILGIMKNIKGEVKKVIEGIYKELSMFEISSINLDFDYKEKEEAKFIKDASKKWQGMKKKFKEISIAISGSWKEVSEKKEKNYFG